MLKSSLISWACCLILFAPLAAGADLQTRKQRSSRDPAVSRIVRVDVDAGRLFITGENLPDGSGVTVRLGGASLKVIRSSRSLVVARLPTTPPKHVDELVVERGVRRAVARGRGLDWGLRLNAPRHETREEPGSWIGVFAPQRTATK